jgi:hypothetical protein
MTFLGNGDQSITARFNISKGIKPARAYTQGSGWVTSNGTVGTGSTVQTCPNRNTILTVKVKGQNSGIPPFNGQRNHAGSLFAGYRPKQSATSHPFQPLPGILSQLLFMLSDPGNAGFKQKGQPGT